MFLFYHENDIIVLMKNAVILHGSSCTPNSFWYPYLKKELEKRGYQVWVPQLPKAEAPDLKIQLPFVIKRVQFTKETILVGHSAGCPLILSVLENIKIRIDKALLVAGYARKLRKQHDPLLKKLERAAEGILQEKYNWEKIKSHVKDIIFINSDNDPWGCDDTEGRYMFDHLGGTLIIKHGEGHMGSDMFHQPYKKFPLLGKLLELN